MNKKDLERKIAEQQELIDRQKRRAKNQNEKAKENWDTVSCRLPKGTKERIAKKNLTVNGLINSLVLKELDRLESEQIQEELKEEKREERKREPLSLEELQKLVDARKEEYNPSEYVEPKKKEKTAAHDPELEKLLQGIKDRRNKENEAQQ